MRQERETPIAREMRLFLEKQSIPTKPANGKIAGNGHIDMEFPGTPGSIFVDGEYVPIDLES